MTLEDRRRWTLDRATLADAEALGALGRREIEGHEFGDLHDARIRALVCSEAHEVRVARGDAGILGFAALLVKPGPGEREHYRLEPRDTALELLGVDLAAQRRGVGRALVEWALDAAAESGYSRLVLLAPAWRDATLRFYEAMGFEATFLVERGALAGTCPMGCCKMFEDVFGMARAIPPRRAPLPRSDTIPMVELRRQELRAVRVIGWGPRRERPAAAWS